MVDMHPRLAAILVEAAKYFDSNLLDGLRQQLASMPVPSDEDAAFAHILQSGEALKLEIGAVVGRELFDLTLEKGRLVVVRLPLRSAAATEIRILASSVELLVHSLSGDGFFLSYTAVTEKAKSNLIGFWVYLGARVPQ